MRYIVQASFALAMLVGLPVLLETPTSPEGMIAATIGALILVAIAIRGVVGFVRRRKPGAYADSIIPPPHQDVESTVIRPKRKDG